jgi:hypothetical protein
VQDTLTKEEWTVRAKVIVNATGVFADKIRKMDDPEAVELIEPAAGAWRATAGHTCGWGVVCVCVCVCCGPLWIEPAAGVHAASLWVRGCLWV